MTSTIITELIQRGKRTPDYYDFRSRENVSLFVYDAFKKDGEANQYFKGQAKYLGTARSTSDHYVMKMKDDDSPLVFQEGNMSPQRGFVRGEMYAVSPQFILAMDCHKMNSVIYNRKVRNFFLEEQESPTKTHSSVSLPAFMYIADDTFFEDEKKDFSFAYSTMTPAQYSGRRLRYYDFTPDKSYKDMKKATEREVNGPDWSTYPFGRWPDVDGYGHGLMQ